MISTQDLYEEIQKIEDVIKVEKDVYKQCQLKALVLQIKLLHNIRTNIVLTMKKLGVETVKPKGKGEREQKKEE